MIFAIIGLTLLIISDVLWMLAAEEQKVRVCAGIMIVVMAGVLSFFAIYSTLNFENNNSQIESSVENTEGIDVWNCQKCGTETNGNFCKECGAKIEKYIICKECEKKVNEEDKYCTNCGVKLE